jgi:DNA-binding NtrC family response regulator
MSESPIKILLIDDNEEYSAVARHYLRSFHNRVFELRWVSSQETALQELSKNGGFDLILMDYFLQGTTGLEITKKLHEENIDIPIILLTGNKDFRIAIEAMKYGIEEYLVKEEAVDTILPRTVVSVIERYQLKRKLQDAEKDTLMTQKKTEAIQELLVTMCHEFNNPLAAIKISTDILARKIGDEESRKLLGRLNQDILQLEKQIIRLRDSNVGE